MDRRVAWIALAAVGCAGSSGKGATARGPQAAPAATTSSASASPPAPSSSAAAPPTPAAEAPPAATAPTTTTPVVEFPPKDFAPPHEKSAAVGDGHWSAFGSTSLRERAAGTPPVIARTVVHPHPDSRWITVTVAALDLRRLSVRLVPGTEDVEWARVPAPAEPGLVPEKDRAGLVAVFNGGFQPKHGRWGVVADGLVITKPREDGCTLALYDDGAARLGPWKDLAASADRMKSLRQTPPCLLHEGALHPWLLAGRDKAWAGHVADLTTRRRSAIGQDASGAVLFYAIGEEADPRWLAEGLRIAGAANAAELDINWYWTRFLLFGESDDGRPRITSTLIPKMEHLETGYVRRPSTRDFFYVVRR